VSQPTAKRKLDSLFERHVLHVRTEIAPALHGMRVEALTWLQLPPNRIEEAGVVLARHPAVRFCVSCTGATQMLIDTVVGDEAALHRFLTQDVAALGVVATQTAVVIQPVRRGPMLMAGMAVSNN
jgi:DNA-binding Lrp family transcriptional regulator